jgi:hypothetical protein
MEFIKVTSGLELFLSAASQLDTVFTVEGDTVTFEQELSAEDIFELESSGSEFVY